MKGLNIIKCLSKIASCNFVLNFGKIVLKQKLSWFAWSEFYQVKNAVQLFRIKCIFSVHQFCFTVFGNKFSLESILDWNWGDNTGGRKEVKMSLNTKSVSNLYMWPLVLILNIFAKLGQFSIFFSISQF